MMSSSVHSQICILQAIPGSRIGPGIIAKDLSHNPFPPRDAISNCLAEEDHTEPDISIVQL
jgi:hypothetical protein